MLLIHFLKVLTDFFMAKNWLNHGSEWIFAHCCSIHIPYKGTITAAKLGHTLQNIQGAISKSARLTIFVVKM
jgi:hypothetical protein